MPVKSSIRLRTFVLGAALCLILIVGGTGLAAGAAYQRAVELRGRVMGIFATLFVGMTPFGALLGGLLAPHLGAPATLLLGSLVVLAASAAFHVRLPALRRSLLAGRAVEPPPGGPSLPPLPTT